MIRKTGIICLWGECLLVCGGAVLGCLPQSLQVGSVPLLLGLILGVALAGATRTRNTLLIYLGLGVALMAGVVFAMPLPTDLVAPVLLRRGMPSLLKFYPEFVRVCAFLLAIPYPFARFGYHAPDRLPESG